MDLTKEKNEFYELSTTRTPTIVQAAQLTGHLDRQWEHIEKLVNKKVKEVKIEFINDLDKAYKQGMREFIQILCDKELGAVLMEVQDRDIKESKEFKKLKSKYKVS